MLRTNKLIFNKEEFEIPRRFNMLASISEDIFNALDETYQYEIKSHVREEIFLEFKDYLVDTKVPEISFDNFFEFSQLSQEFKVLNDILEEKKRKWAEYEQIAEQFIPKFEELSQQVKYLLLQQNNQSIYFGGEIAEKLNQIDIRLQSQEERLNELQGIVDKQTSQIDELNEKTKEIDNLLLESIDNTEKIIEEINISQKEKIDDLFLSLNELKDMNSLTVEKQDDQYEEFKDLQTKFSTVLKIIKEDIMYNLKTCFRTKAYEIYSGKRKREISGRLKNEIIDKKSGSYLHNISYYEKIILPVMEAFPDIIKEQQDKIKMTLEFGIQLQNDELQNINRFRDNNNINYSHNIDLDKQYVDDLMRIQKLMQ